MERTGRAAAIRFWICYAAYTSIYISRVNLSMASPELETAFVFSTEQIGLLGSAFSVVYAIGRLCNGTAGDRVAPWVMIFSGLAAAGCSNLLAGALPTFEGMLILWMINAYGQSMLWSSELCVMRALYDGPTAKRRTAYLVTAVATGNMAGILLNGWLVSRWGVRWAFLMPGLLNLVMGAAVLAAVRGIPAPSRGQSGHLSMLRLLGRADVRRTLIPAFCHGVMKDNISLWMAMYFLRRFGIRVGQSVWYLLLIPAIGLVGRLAYNGVLGICREKEDAVSAWGFAVCMAASACLALRVPSPLAAAVCLGLTYAAASMINTSILSIFPMRYAESGNVASVSGLMDFAVYLGAGVGSAVFGFLIRSAGYEAMFVTWTAVSALSVLVILRGARAADAE